MFLPKRSFPNYHTHKKWSYLETISLFIIELQSNNLLAFNNLNHF